MFDFFNLIILNNPFFGPIIALIPIFIILIIITYLYIINQLNKYDFKKNSIEIHQRLKRNKTIDFERNTIIPVCTSDFFKNYYLFCINKNTWNDLYSRLINHDKIFFALKSDVKIAKEELNVLYFKPSTLFITLKGYFLIYKIFNTHKTMASDKIKPQLSFHYNDIKKVQYNILQNQTHSQDPRIMAKITIKLNDDKYIEFEADTLTAEIIIEMKNSVLDYAKIPYDKQSYKKMTDRQNKKLKTALICRYLNNNVYDCLSKKLHYTYDNKCNIIKKQLFEESF
ncbi:MAG: hypothetical protein AB1782_05645 [Cyanobacteriota bacterium]